MLQATVVGHPSDLAPPTRTDRAEGGVAAEGEARRLARMAQATAAAEELALRRHAESPLVYGSGDSGARSALSAKFYVYGGLDWLAMKCEGIPIGDVFRTGKMHAKHSDDYWFLRAAMSHPLRTEDPEKAELFVVPALLNVLSDTWFWSHMQCCIGDLCNDDLLGYVEDMLAESPWFKRSEGRDHVIVMSHYATTGYVVEPDYSRVLQCNSISFAENSMQGGRCHIAKMYGGVRCDHMSKKFAFGMVAALRPKRARFRARRDICSWLHDLSEHNTSYSFSSCGEGEQCPALALAKFGFHVRGDTWGSQRPVDAILSGTVPMFTDEKQYEIVPPWLPWRNVSVLIDISDEAHFEASLRESLPRYEAVKAAMDAWASSVDWEVGGPFEPFMGAFQQCAKQLAA